MKFYAPNDQITSISVEGTEYPVVKGAITVEGEVTEELVQKLAEHGFTGKKPAADKPAA